ncbi:MAG TPA: nucleotide-diphospho-sugar transferase, partial [Armatimonadota bacterium]
HDRLMVDYIVDALTETPSISAIVIVAPELVLKELHHLPVHHAVSGQSLVETMQQGAKALAAQHLTHLLFITEDIPLVTADALEAYLQASLECGASLTYPIIPRRDCEESFPGAKRTYVRLKEDTYTGGNVVFTTTTFLDDKSGLIRDVYNMRKHPLQLAGLLGWGTLARLLLGTLTLPAIESVASRILGAPARAVITPYPEIGFDVDKLEDLEIVEQVLGDSHGIISEG